MFMRKKTEFVAIRINEEPWIIPDQVVSLRLKVEF